MTTPFYKYGFFGDETSLVVAFLIGSASASSWSGRVSAARGSSSRSST